MSALTPPTLDELAKSLAPHFEGEGPRLQLGAAMLRGAPIPGICASVPLKTLNRHGLIAGATGTGKTKTLQVIAEQLSEAGVPVLLMDIKGDLSGIAAPGASHPKIDARHAVLKLPWQPRSFPVEFLTLSDEPGVRLRATVSEFGPVLCAKILGLNDTQSGILSILFKYCDDKKLPLLDLKDLKKTLQFAGTEGNDELEKEYGHIAASSLGAIVRRLVELEQQGADRFFGEPSFDVGDLMRTDPDGRGRISVLRVTDIQDRPKLFSTFMLSLLAELYAGLPEAGDLEAPKLVLFIDEAHLVFDEASPELLHQLEAVVKLIRSKGVGVFFVTQNPDDVPAEILSQLGLRVQHALRAVTARDRKAIKLAAENFPSTELFNTTETLTQLGIGEALVTGLDEKGRPTPLLHTLLRAPQSRMGVLSEPELNHQVQSSALVAKYAQTVDGPSAYELLTQKLEHAQSAEAQAKVDSVQKAARKAAPRETSFFEDLSKNTMVRQLGRTAMREVLRGLLGVLGIKKRR